MIKHKIQIKYTEAILSNSTRKLLCFEITKMLIAVYHSDRQALSTLHRRGVVFSGVRRMNEVNARRARLVPGWVTVFGRVYHLGM